jgi:hypothetical protein
MNKKRKQANRLGFLFLIFFSLCGGLLIYRSGISEKDLLTYEGVLEKAITSSGFGNYGRNYAILFEFKDSDRRFGIYGGTKEQANRQLKEMDLISGNHYEILIDQTVGKYFNGINLGIRQINSNSKEIYKENNNASFSFGLMFILLGIISSASFYLIAKRKFK